MGQSPSPKHNALGVEVRRCSVLTALAQTTAPCLDCVSFLNVDSCQGCQEMFGPLPDQGTSASGQMRRSCPACAESPSEGSKGSRVRRPSRYAPAPELTRPWRSKQAITPPPLQSSMQPRPLRTPACPHRFNDPCGKWVVPDGASSWLASKTSPVFQRPSTSSLAITSNLAQGAGSCVRARSGCRVLLICMQKMEGHAHGPEHPPVP